jgi:hypothetical protein
MIEKIWQFLQDGGTLQGYIALSGQFGKKNIIEDLTASLEKEYGKEEVNNIIEKNNLDALNINSSDITRNFLSRILSNNLIIPSEIENIFADLQISLAFSLCKARKLSPNLVTNIFIELGFFKGLDTETSLNRLFNYAGRGLSLDIIEALAKKLEIDLDEELD